MSTLNAINDKMHKAVSQVGGRIDAIFFCPDTAESKSLYRKPAPGMFLEIGERFEVPLEGVPAVGDSLRDLQAAAAVRRARSSCSPARARRRARRAACREGTEVFADLAAVAEALAA